VPLPGLPNARDLAVPRGGSVRQAIEVPRIPVGTRVVLSAARDARSIGRSAECGLTPARGEIAARVPRSARVVYAYLVNMGPTTVELSDPHLEAYADGLSRNPR